MKLPQRKQIRLHGYDYSQSGLYFITICTYQKKNIFGTIENGEMKLNIAGEIANDEIKKTEKIRKNITIDSWIIMPNHIHFIINIHRAGECNTPGVCNTPLRSPSQTIGAIVRGYKSSVTKQICDINGNNKIWHRNYYEHIIRNEHAHNQITKYIQNNPQKWDIDSLK